MANYATLKAAIAAAIQQNGNNEITGNLLQQQLLAMVNSLGVGYQYAGIATPATNPGTPDQNVFYLASTAGTYTNFGGFVLDDGEIAILKYNGAWSKDSTGAASLEKVNQLGQEVSPNFVFVQGYYRPTDGSTYSDSMVEATDYRTITLPVKEGDVFDLNCFAGKAAGQYGIYNSSGQKTRGGNTGQQLTETITIGAGEVLLVTNYNSSFPHYLKYNGVVNLALSARNEIPKVVNNLTDGGVNAALSAEQGKNIGAMIPDLPIGTSVSTLSANYTAGQTVIFNPAFSLSQDIDAYIRVFGLTGIIRIMTSSYLALAQYTVNDGDILHVKIPSNAVIMTAKATDESATGTVKIVIGKNTGETAIYNHITNLGSRIGDQMESVSVTEKRLRFRVKGPFSLRVKSGFAVYYIVRENDDDIRSNDSNLVAVQDYSRTFFETENGGTYLVDFAKQDNSNIYIYDDIIDEYISGINGLRKFAHQNSVSPKFEVSQLDFQYFNLRYGSIDNSGVINSGPHVYTELIPIRPLSTIDMSVINFTPSEGYYQKVYAWFYYIDEKGNITYISNAYTTDAALHFIGRVPSKANAVRFMFTRWHNGGWEQMDIERIKYIYKVIAETTDVFVDTEYIINNADDNILTLGTSTDWIQGRATLGTNPNSNSVTTAKPIKVTAGHKYMFLWNPIYNTDKLLWTIRLELLATIDGSAIDSGQIYRVLPVFTIPKGINYVRIVAEGDYNTTAITPAMAAEQGFQMYDITAKYAAIPGATKIIPITYSPSRYAQGMAISNGYIFQAFSDGTIDIYSAESLEMVQMVELPLVGGTIVPHCNNIQFGDYYNDSDPFPVLYVSADTGGAIMKVRFAGTIGSLVASNIEEIPAPTLDGSVYIAATQIMDLTNKKMLQYSYEKETLYDGNLNGYNNVHIQVFSYDTLNSSVTYTEEYSVTVPRIFPIQGGRFIDGRCYLVYGGGSQMKAIFIFDIYKGIITNFIDLTNQVFGLLSSSEEPQALDVYNGIRYLSTTKGIYKFII